LKGAYFRQAVKNLAEAKAINLKEQAEADAEAADLFANVE
jgi:hypothetical protein